MGVIQKWKKQEVTEATEVNEAIESAFAATSGSLMHDPYAKFGDWI